MNPFRFAAVDTLLAARHGLPVGEVLSLSSVAKTLSSPTVRAGGRVEKGRKVHHTKVSQWRTLGVDLWEADQIATALGLVPWQIWPDWSQVADTTIPAALFDEWADAS